MATETVVVLFTDVVGSTDLLSRVGEARADELRREVFVLSRAAISAAGGREVKNTGDGLMVVFGAASAAIDAAVGVQQSLARRNQRADEPVFLRIGVSMGECDAEDGDYFGRPVVEAARLCAAADAGQVLTADVVRLFAGTRTEHEFVSLGSLELKGLDEPVAASEVRWAVPDAAGAVPLPARLTRAPGTLFVGRDDKRAALLDAFKETAASGRRRVAFLSGEPGIGKTTLVCETAAAVVAAGGVALYGRCEEDLSVPYEPWREALAYLAQHVPAAVEPARDVLAPLIGGERISAHADAESERYLLYSTVVECLARASAEAPLLVVLDDLHWADAPTVALLRHVVGAAASLQVLIVGTFRDADLGVDDPMTPALAALHREDGVDRIMLTGLGDADILTMLEQLAGHEMDEAGLELRDALLAETTGNPFFVEEMLRHLAETGAIAQGATGRWEASTDLRDRGLPVSVREVVVRRIDRLGPDTRRALEYASVIGRDFELDLLAVVLERDVDDTLDLVEPAVDASLIRDVAPGRFSFAHALTGHALYDGLSPTRRSRVHALVAAALEEQCGDELGARTAELAHHWAQATTAREPAKAIDYAVRAGEYALGQFAPDEAARWFERALELAGDGDGDAGGGRALWRATALAGLGEARRQLGDAAFREPLFEAGKLAQELGATDILVRAALATNREMFSQLGVRHDDVIALLAAALAATEGEQSGRRALILICLATEIGYFEPERARDLGLEAIAMVRGVGDVETLCAVALRTSTAIRFPDTLGTRREFLDEALAAALASGNPALVYVANRAAGAALEAADVERWEEVFPLVEAAAERTGQPSRRWVTVFNRANRAMVAGDLDVAEAHATEALELGLASAEPDALQLYGAQLLTIRWLQGRGGEVLELMEQGFADTPAVAGYRHALAMWYSSLGRFDEARALISTEVDSAFANLTRGLQWLDNAHFCSETVTRLGLSDSARAIYALLAPYADRLLNNDLFSYNVVHLDLANLAATFGDYDRAESHYSAAHEAHERIGAKHSLAKTQADWATMLVTRGNPDDLPRARELAERALAASQQHGYGAVAGRAATVLER